MVGFVLLVVEAMVAAPFWAAAHAVSVSEAGLPGELGRRGYFQLLEILFRPPLYVIGFFVIFMIEGAMAWMVARIFEIYYNNYAAAEVGSMGLISNLFFLLILCGLFMYMYYYLCSEGYSALPRKVIRWIGGEGQTLGAAQNAEKLRAMLVGGINSGGAGAVHQAAAGGTGGGGGGAMAPAKTSKTSETDGPPVPRPNTAKK